MSNVQLQQNATCILLFPSIVGYFSVLCTLCGWHKNGKGVYIHYSSVPTAQERVYIYSYPSVCCAYAGEEGMGGELLGGKGLTHVTADTHTPIAHVSLPTPQIHYPSRVVLIPSWTCSKYTVHRGRILGCNWDKSLKSSVADPWYSGVDPNPRIHASD